MAVDDREVVVVILLAHEAAGVLAEGAHLVLERLRIADQLRFIEHVVDGLHDLVAHLDAHADVDGAGRVGDVVARAELVEPVRAAAAGGDDRVPGVDLVRVAALRKVRAEADAVPDDEVGAGAAEADLYAVFEQVLFDGGVDFLRLFGAEVADRAVDELQAGLDRALADLLDGVLFAHALDVLVRAEFEVNRVGVVDQGLREVVADELRQVAADLGREGELAV